MIQIGLHNLVFYAFHGIHEEERILGAEFEVNADLYYNEPVMVINQLEQTIDYSKVYALISRYMQQPTPLLETLCMEIAAGIKNEFPVTKEIVIRIKKINPPIAGFTGNTEVGYHKKYNES